ncbi:4-oxalocrotonate tautomerase [Paraburkholderia sp. Ac-20340]|uniref:tautomerase family protein n=1 Tax=Paraburkholderia sp. Ac-20340 TaxID=2703888 RepID=UPI00197F0109|nr:tautomerase family protein [Paraburkholderia sp. Ac-20340]MBN3851800.1 4-oxalocrotonate tautomerase [Paraburkholderia sp. Ac-20340]
MPHVIVKAWPGRTEAQKHKLADAITREVMAILGYGEESVSVAFEEIEANRWKDDVYVPDIQKRPEILIKKPGYRM